MIKTVKVMLVPNNKQQTRLFQCANTARFAYNWALRKERENHKNGKGWLSIDELEKQFEQLKQSKKYQWLSEIPKDITNQAMKDAGNAYKSFLSGACQCPGFKNKKRSQLCFYPQGRKLEFTNTHVKVEGLSTTTKKSRQKFNWIRMAQHNEIPVNGQYNNPHVFYERKNWYIKVGVLKPEESSQNQEDCIYEKKNKNAEKSEGKKRNLTSGLNGDTDKETERLERIKKLEKRRRRIKRSIARKYEKNKKGDTYYKTRNIIKKEKELLKWNHKLANIQKQTGEG